MLLYLIAVVIGFVAGLIYINSRPSTLDKNVMKSLYLGKRVVICIDEDATIFKMVGNKIRITKAITNVTEDDSDILDDLQSDKSTQHFSELP